MEIGIVAQRGNGAARDLADELRGALRSQDVDVLVDETTGDDLGIEGVPVERMADCPMVVSIGGDGTFLYVARGVGSTPILGVNLGEVGFLNAVPPEDATDRVVAEVERIREAGEPQYRDVRRLSATADGHTIPPALNEIVVQGPQRGRGNGLDVAVRVDGSTYVETHADGVLVATPTGSTAYSLSEGGPLVHPGVDALVLSGMATTSPMRSVLVPPDATVEIEATGAAHAVVASDGSERQTVETPATVTVAATDEPGRIAGPRSDFFRALSKLE